MSGLRGLLCACCVLALVQCGSSNTTCNGVGFVAPLIVVTNADTGAAICDAHVVAVGPAGLSSSTNTLTAGREPRGVDPGSCWFDGPGTEGTYVITVSRDGFVSETVSGIAPRIQACDSFSATLPEIVRVALPPN